MSITANRMLSGSFAEIWVDGLRIAEANAIQLSIKAERADVQIGVDVDSKIIGLRGEGHLKLKQVFTRFYNVLEGARKGMDVRLTIMTALKDPDAVDGAEERYRISGVAFTELPLINYETGKINQQTVQFRFAPSKLENIAQITPGGDQ